MNRVTWIAFGVVFTVFSSLAGLVIIPDWQYRDLAAYQNELDEVYPVRPSGFVAQGRGVYIDLGCVYCHSQQVRPEGYGADIDRGWGMRRTVARDYIYDSPPLMGSMRTGPDLSNIGARQPSKEWHYLHLYNPQITSQGSVMPEYPFLFDVVKNPEREPFGGIRLPDQWASEPTWIVPRPRAEQLVEYLKSLDRGFDLPEAQ